MECNRILASYGMCLKANESEVNSVTARKARLVAARGSYLLAKSILDRKWAMKWSVRGEMALNAKRIDYEI